jgi:hypothetical protein
MWQEIIVGICVLAAAYFVLRQWLPMGKKKTSGCGGCGTGSSNCTTAASTDSNSAGTSKPCDPSSR